MLMHCLMTRILKQMILMLVLSFTLPIWAMAAQPLNIQQAEPDRLNSYLKQVIHPQAFRNYQNIQELDRVAAFIKQQVEQFSIPCEYQTYAVDGKNYRNVVCHLQMGHAKKVILGAHYDVYGNFKGADDNASGVVGLIETARILATNRRQLKQNIDFVFYTLEEPPYFRTEHMGSFIHAQSILKQKDQIQAVYILEMIGYFDHKNVQDYPSGLAAFYPKHANFIGAVSNFSSRAIGEKYCSSMKNLKRLDCQRLIAPSFVKGVDFSDHLNYWRFDIPAIMITDTAFFRNKHYHTPEDTVEKLNLNKMADVVDGLVNTLLKD
ncbi:M28 family peptidase [Acinetobacter bereziniae]|nr:M28 family peptidase [Acinetobacter bereziniae]MBJ8442938.1 M28 family peptidase [Acinetobacter bereziniae]